MSGPAQPYPVHAALEAEDAKSALRTAIRSVRDAERVGLYAARPAEPGTAPLLDSLDDLGKTILLPVLGAGLQRDWAPYAGAHDLLQRAPGRPPEPSGDPVGPSALEEVDIVIAPALAVDSSGTRLGQGGGWYDRALTFVRPDVKIVALVFPEEFYDAVERPLPREQHDRPVHGFATPQGWEWITA